VVAIDSGAGVPGDVAVFSLEPRGTITGVVVTKMSALRTIVAGHGGASIGACVNADKARPAHVTIANRIAGLAAETKGPVADFGGRVSTAVVVPKPGVRKGRVVEAIAAGDLGAPGETGRRRDIDASPGGGDVPPVVCAAGQFVALLARVIVCLVGGEPDPTAGVRQLRTLIKPREGVSHQGVLAPAQSIKECRVIHRRVLALKEISFGYPKLIAVVVEILERCVGIELLRDKLIVTEHCDGGPAAAGGRQLVAEKESRGLVPVDAPCAFAVSVEEAGVIDDGVVTGTLPLTLGAQDVAVGVEVSKPLGHRLIIGAAPQIRNTGAVGCSGVADNISGVVVFNQIPLTRAGAEKIRVRGEFIVAGVLPPLILFGRAKVKNVLQGGGALAVDLLDSLNIHGA